MLCWRQVNFYEVIHFPLYQGRILVEILGELEKNFGKVAKNFGVVQQSSSRPPWKLVRA